MRTRNIAFGCVASALLARLTLRLKGRKGADRHARERVSVARGDAHARLLAEKADASRCDLQWGVAAGDADPQHRVWLRCISSSLRPSCSSERLSDSELDESHENLESINNSLAPHLFDALSTDRFCILLFTPYRPICNRLIPAPHTRHSTDSNTCTCSAACRAASMTASHRHTLTFPTLDVPSGASLIANRTLHPAMHRTLHPAMQHTSSRAHRMLVAIRATP